MVQAVTIIDLIVQTVISKFSFLMQDIFVIGIEIQTVLVIFKGVHMWSVDICGTGT